MSQRGLLPYLLFFLLLVVVLSLATGIQPRAVNWGRRGESEGLLKVILGDGRRLFADYYFVKADVYFHSGYYPSIFDRSQAPKDTRHMTQQDDESHDHPSGEHPAPKDQPGQPDQQQQQTDHDADHQPDHAEDAHEREMAFLKKPKDWIEAFGRRFMITDHTHLQAGAEREILPWLRISAELDPERIETYTVAAFWLRNRLQKVKEAETFLREGLKANPNSHEILFELGRLYYENDHDPVRARNVWELALRKWTTLEITKKEPNLFELEQITVHLARLEEDQGNLQRAIELLRMAMKATPRPDLLQKQVDDLQKRLSTPPSAAGL